MKPLKIFDTTISDGELSSLFNPSLKSREEIADSLELAGIDIIEVASTADDSDRLSHSKKIASTIKNATVCCISKLMQHDLDIAKSVLESAEKSRIHLYLDAKQARLIESNVEDAEQILDKASEVIDIATKHFDEVQFSPQDATRLNLNTLIQL